MKSVFKYIQLALFLWLVALSANTVNAQQLVVVSDTAKNNSFYNKLMVDWKKNYNRDFRIIRNHSQKVMVEVFPDFSESEKQKFFQTEISKVFDLQFVSPKNNLKQQRKLNSRSIDKSKIM